MRCALVPPRPGDRPRGACCASIAAAEEPFPVRVQPVQRPVAKGKTTTAAAEPLSDDDALKKANLSETDGEKLIEYLQQRTLTETEQGRITEIIKRFGVDDFEERVRATEEIESYGPAAIGPLKAAGSDADPEVAFRARQALKKVETVPHSAVAAAAVRAVVKLKPDGAAAALIGFLPLADDESVADVIRDGARRLAVAQGRQGRPGIVAALSDASPIRRAAAYVALDPGRPRDRAHPHQGRLPEGPRSDSRRKPTSRPSFVGLWSLALTTREKEFIPELIALIPKLPRGRIWQLEDFLLQLAGTHPKDGRFLKSPESLAKTRDAWLAWWKEKGDAIDLVKIEYKPRVTGVTDIIEIGRSLWRAGPARFARARPQGEVADHGCSTRPTDARDRAERQRLRRRIELSTGSPSAAPAGKLISNDQHRPATRQPQSSPGRRAARDLPEQRLRVRQGLEADAERTTRGTTYDVMAGDRLPNGEMLVITNNGQPKATGMRPRRQVEGHRQPKFALRPDLQPARHRRDRRRQGAGLRVEQGRRVRPQDRQADVEARLQQPEFLPAPAERQHADLPE